MLTDMLDAPVAKLTMSDDIDTCEHFVDAGTLFRFSTDGNTCLVVSQHTLSSSRQFSKSFCQTWHAYR